LEITLTEMTGKFMLTIETSQNNGVERHKLTNILT